ncbi:MAG: DUF6748 domain-containing protein [Thermodesulfobacteriota bacterium]|nr:DUF6748 domain-containing protein [Thermodesulfobacteriota bacterium]
MRIFNSILLCIFFFLAFINTSYADNSTYWTIQKDYRKCMYPMCGGYWVKRVNRAQTPCADRELKEQCYVVDLDWSATDLSELQISELENSLNMLLVRGEREEASFFDIQEGTFYNLKVQEAWLAVTDEKARGWFVRLYDNGVRCITTPCASIDQAFLNTVFTISIHEVDLLATNATDEQITDGMNAIFNSEDGLIAAGTNKFFIEDFSIGINFWATQFFLRVESDIKE